VQSRLGRNPWQVDPDFKVQFFTFYQKFFCMFHWRCLSLNLVQKFQRKFCKENDSFDELE
jgi:hypothetical protein